MWEGQCTGIIRDRRESKERGRRRKESGRRRKKRERRLCEDLRQPRLLETGVRGTGSKKPRFPSSLRLRMVHRDTQYSLQVSVTLFKRAEGIIQARTGATIPHTGTLETAAAIVTQTPSFFDPLGRHHESPCRLGPLKTPLRTHVMRLHGSHVLFMLYVLGPHETRVNIRPIRWTMFSRRPIGYSKQTGAGWGLFVASIMAFIGLASTKERSAGIHFF